MCSGSTTVWLLAELDPPRIPVVADPKSEARALGSARASGVSIRITDLSGRLASHDQ